MGKRNKEQLLKKIENGLKISSLSGQTFLLTVF